MKVLIYSRQKIDFWKFPEWVVAELKKEFPDIDFLISYGERPLEELITDADILITSRLTPEEFSRARKLKWIHSPFVGIGNFLFEEFVKSPVKLTNSRGVNAEAVIIHTITLALSLLRGIPWAFKLKNERTFNQEFFVKDFFPLEPPEVNVGIMGFGKIGKGVGKRLKSLGFKVKCLNRSGKKGCFPFEKLDQFLEGIDFLIITAPRTRLSEGCIDYERMKKLNGFIVNTGRGKIIVEKDLVKALREGIIKGAALDVFESEPLHPESPLWKMPNVIITPHISGFSRQFWKRELELIKENLKRFIQGKRLKNLVNKKLGY